MAALDRPRVTDETPKLAERRQAEEDRQTARVKLTALAGDVADLGLRYRLLESGPESPPLLRVWNPGRQAVGETVACVRTDEGWRFALHPFGPVIGSAEGVQQPGDAKEAAHVIVVLAVTGQTS